MSNEEEPSCAAMEADSDHDLTMRWCADCYLTARSISPKSRMRLDLQENASGNLLFNTEERRLQIENHIDLRNSPNETQSTRRSALDCQWWDWVKPIVCLSTISYACCGKQRLVQSLGEMLFRFIAHWKSAIFASLNARMEDFLFFPSLRCLLEVPRRLAFRRNTEQRAALVALTQHAMIGSSTSMLGTY
jgi:hypothetical protein